MDSDSILIETLRRERDEAREELVRWKLDFMGELNRVLTKGIEERDEARNLAREMLDWIEGMRPDWEGRFPWLKEVK